MGRMIADENGGGGDFNPTASLKEEGAMLKGTLVSRKRARWWTHLRLHDWRANWPR
jgi:hypothetical protein